MDKYAILKEYFGYTEFRPGQETLIDGLLQGRDALGVMPTGGGKSICYQIPALLMPGITLVVSPLISLMKDQVSALKSAGVGAAFINSSLSPTQLGLAYRRIREGRYRIIYVAPERLGVDSFVELMREQTISLIAVDEAHCISQWGQDFRPSYLKIVEFIERLPSRPVLSAFTATATAEVRRDIALALKLREPVNVVTGFDRPNLFFDVMEPKSKIDALSALMEERVNQSGIIYCATRAEVERVCDRLKAEGLTATRYHAGLTDAERRKNQEDFQADRSTVMVATNAFGMGIDKSNIGFVIHYNMPKSVEAYYQEAGRAGRDGEKADCILLFSAGDVVTAKYLIRNGGANEDLSPEEQARIKARDFERLDQMTGYCKTSGCLRGYLLDYFGQAHEARCGNCGNCNGDFATADITPQAQMILSCVRRIKDKLGYYVGDTLVVRVLNGSRDKRVLEMGLDELTTYGLMRKVTRPRIREYIDFLIFKGYLRHNPEYRTVELTERSAAVLFQNEKVTMLQREPSSIVAAAVKRVKQAVLNSGAEDGGLFDALRSVRTGLAQKEGVPAYVIFSNASLRDMAQKKPLNREEFLNVSGVGDIKAERYGEVFMNAILKYERGLE